MKHTKKNYANITRIALMLGMESDLHEGFYRHKGTNKIVDLTASGDEVLQVAKNILEQL